MRGGNGGGRRRSRVPGGHSSAAQVASLVSRRRFFLVFVSPCGVCERERTRLLSVVDMGEKEVSIKNAKKGEEDGRSRSPPPKYLCKSARRAGRSGFLFSSVGHLKSKSKCSRSGGEVREKLHPLPRCSAHS